MESNQNQQKGDSSKDDEEWFSKFKKNEIIQNPSFTDDIKSTARYLETLRLTVDAFTSILMANGTLGSDKIPAPSSPIKCVSAWASLADAISGTHFGQQDGEMAKYADMCHSVAEAEESVWKLSAKCTSANIFTAATEQRKKVDDLDKMIEASLIRCNKRRRKVENAQILPDLCDQGRKYMASVEKLDTESFEMSKLVATINDDIYHHFEHIKRILPNILLICKKRRDIFSTQDIKGPKSISTSTQREIDEKTMKF